MKPSIKLFPETRKSEQNISQFQIPGLNPEGAFIRDSDLYCLQIHIIFVSDVLRVKLLLYFFCYKSFFFFFFFFYLSKKFENQDPSLYGGSRSLGLFKKG